MRSEVDTQPACCASCAGKRTKSENEIVWFTVLLGVASLRPCKPGQADRRHPEVERVAIDRRIAHIHPAPAPDSTAVFVK